MDILEYLSGLAPAGETALVVRQKPVTRGGEPLLHADGTPKYTWPAFLPGARQRKEGEAWYINTGSFILDRFTDGKAIPIEEALAAPPAAPGNYADLMERLRDPARFAATGRDIEAADALAAMQARIAALEEALEKIANGPRDVDLSYAELFVQVCAEARAALKGEK